MSLLAKLLQEAHDELPCPTCGRERQYGRVWTRYVGYDEGHMTLACPEHGPFSDPEVVTRSSATRRDPEA